MAYGNHIFIAFGLQANTHVNVHQELKDVKLWQVTLFRLVFIFSLVLYSNHIHFGDCSFVKLGSYSPKRIGENSCQCRHSNVGLWGL